MSDRAIVAYFEAAADRYDGRINAFVGERELRAVRALVPERSAVLDFGCGTGRTTLDLLRRGCRVTAYDRATAMLDVAARRARACGFDAEFVAEPSALGERQWPVVTCVGVLDYYRDPTKVLRRLRRHLAPGGRIVVTVPNARSPLGWVYAARGRLSALAVTLRTERSLTRAAARAGLGVVAVRRAFPAVRGLALTIVAALAPSPAAAGLVPPSRRSNLLPRAPVEFDAPTARAME